VKRGADRLDRAWGPVDYRNFACVRSFCLGLAAARHRLIRVVLGSSSGGFVGHGAFLLLTVPKVCRLTNCYYQLEDVDNASRCLYVGRSELGRPRTV